METLETQNTAMQSRSSVTEARGPILAAAAAAAATTTITTTTPTTTTTATIITTDDDDVMKKNMYINHDQSAGSYINCSECNKISVIFIFVFVFVRHSFLQTLATK
jgi:hypothetical protein